jgi:hypothetical protein
MQRRMNLAVAVTVVVGMTACSSVPGGAPATSTATVMAPGSTLQARGEAVFRLQNAVMDELIAAAELESNLAEVAAEGLAAAEGRIVDSCRELNEAASIRAGGGEPGLSLKLRVLDSLTRCENAALAARAYLRADSSNLSASTP